MRNVELPDSVEREILVIDDGSDDGTRDVLKQLGDSTVRGLTSDTAQQGRRGEKGSNTRGDSFVQDADLSTTPKTGPASCIPSSAAGPASSTDRGSPVNAATCCSSTGSATASCR